MEEFVFINKIQDLILEHGRQKSNRARFLLMHTRDKAVFFDEM